MAEKIFDQKKKPPRKKCFLFGALQLHDATVKPLENSIALQKPKKTNPSKKNTGLIGWVLFCGLVFWAHLWKSKFILSQVQSWSVTKNSLTHSEQFFHSNMLVGRSLWISKKSGTSLWYPKNQEQAFDIQKIRNKPLISKKSGTSLWYPKNQEQAFDIQKIRNKPLISKKSGTSLWYPKNQEQAFDIQKIRNKPLIYQKSDPHQIHPILPPLRIKACLARLLAPETPPAIGCQWDNASVKITTKWGPLFWMTKGPIKWWYGQTLKIEVDRCIYIYMQEYPRNSYETKDVLFLSLRNQNQMVLCIIESLPLPQRHSMPENTPITPTFKISLKGNLCNKKSHRSPKIGSLSRFPTHFFKKIHQPLANSKTYQTYPQDLLSKCSLGTHSLPWLRSARPGINPRKRLKGDSLVCYLKGPPKTQIWKGNWMSSKNQHPFFSGHNFFVSF